MAMSDECKQAFAQEMQVLEQINSSLSVLSQGVINHGFFEKFNTLSSDVSQLKEDIRALRVGLLGDIKDV